MHTRFLVDAVRAPSVVRAGRASAAAGLCTASIPDATDIIPRDDLREPAGLNVPDLDKSRVEEEDIGLVPGDAFSGTFPLYGAGGPGGIAVPIDIDAELYCE